MIMESDVQILGRLLELEGKSLSPEKAKVVLSIKFSRADQRRIDALAEKSSQGLLTDSEKELYASYVRVMTLLGTLQSRARLALRKLRKTG